MKGERALEIIGGVCILLNVALSLWDHEWYAATGWFAAGLSMAVTLLRKYDV